MFIDAIVVKVRDGQVANRPFYAAIGVSLAGERDILGLWAGSGGEGAKFWMAVLTDVRNRGIKDTFFVVCDGLKGLPEVVSNVWPDALVQTCIIHLIRNTFRLTSRQYWDEFKRDIKPIYTAVNEAAARAAFDDLAEKWGARYPAVIRLWDNAWAEFIPFLDYDVEIRRVICSTDEIVKPGRVFLVASEPPALRRHVRLVRRRFSPRCVFACRCRPRQAVRSCRVETVHRRRARVCGACGSLARVGQMRSPGLW